ncbi:PQQ-like beta-propeller repeat protein [bacterium]|nr:PQQ-like beta-propeller repeat protein [bacterium]
MNKKTIFPLLLIVVALAGLYCQKQQAEWPRWRGPAGDNVSTEINWNPAALDGDPIVLWKAQLGKGYSAPAIKDDRLYTMGNVMEVQNDDTVFMDVVYCLDAETGTEIWTYKYACEPGMWAGPRATPNLEDKRLYTLSRSGHVFCLDAGNGSVIWQRNLFTDSLAIDPDFGLSGSPVIHEDLLILNAAKAGLALNKLTGETVWKSELGKNGFASPVLYTVDNTAKAAIFSRVELYQVDAATGVVDWMIPWKTPYEENVADPIVHGDNMFISTGNRRGCALLNLTGEQAEILWENKNMCNHFTGSILLDGRLYGIDGGARKKCTFKCMDFMTGEVLWEEPFEFSALTSAGGYILALSESGTLHVVEANSEAFTLVASAKVIEQHTFEKGTMPWHTFCAAWTPPVLCNGLIYVRNNYGDFVCLDVR